MTNTVISNKKIGIIAGGGELSANVIDKCRELGKEIFVITFINQDKPTNFNTLAINEHKEFGLGSVGSVIKEMEQQNVEEIVFAGYISKPSLFNLKLDLTGMKILAKVAVHHDNQILNAISEEFTSRGFIMLGAHQICTDLLIGDEILSGAKIAKEKSEDIMLGVNIVKEIGKLDIGQAAIVKDKVILGVEAIEGTDALLERCANLRGKENKGGILVKLAKPQQNLNLDMPTIGINTIKKLIELNYSGIVFSANSTVFLNKDECIKLAEKHNILIAGVDVNDVEE